MCHVVGCSICCESSKCQGPSSRLGCRQDASCSGVVSVLQVVPLFHDIEAGLHDCKVLQGFLGQACVSHTYVGVFQLLLTDRYQTLYHSCGVDLT